MVKKVKITAELEVSISDGHPNPDQLIEAMVASLVYDPNTPDVAISGSDTTLVGVED